MHNSLDYLGMLYDLIMSHARTYALKLLLLACAYSMLGMATSANSQTIEAWSYYAAEPFQTDASTNAGLAQDLVSYLNQELAGKRQLKLVLLPRTRLNLLLEKGEKGLVLLAPSVIFGGNNGGHYLWSSALIDDNQEFISRAEKPFEYAAPSSLFGVRFLAMRGHNFPRLQKEIDEGKIVADRADKERSLIHMLLARRADVVTLPASVIDYFSKTDPAAMQGLHLSGKKLESFSRHLMFQAGMEAELRDLEPIVLKMNSDPKWIAILRKYGLKPRQKLR